MFVGKAFYQMGRIYNERSDWPLNGKMGLISEAEKTYLKT